MQPACGKLGVDPSLSSCSYAFSAHTAWDFDSRDWGFQVSVLIAGPGWAGTTADLAPEPKARGRPVTLTSSWAQVSCGAGATGGVWVPGQLTSQDPRHSGRAPTSECRVMPRVLAGSHESQSLDLGLSLTCWLVDLSLPTQSLGFPSLNCGT